MWRLVFLLFFSCSLDTTDSVERFFYRAPLYEYTELSIPIFLDSLIVNHRSDFERIYEPEFTTDLENLGVATNESVNRDKYFQLKILHDLFTSQGAYNGAKGNIWVIPYIWHWVEPNPRHDIIQNKENIALKKCDSPKRFSRYKSFADIDRTPSLYLTDFFSGLDTYSSKECSSFSTFGWCSEREMAFVSLLRINGYDAKVTSDNGHSWTEVIVPMKDNDNLEQSYKFTIDNTFDKFYIAPFNKSAYPEWKKLLGNSKTKNWYNEKAFSKAEHEIIENFIVKDSVSNHLEKQVVEFLNRRI